jgi:hypothetical protein
MNDNNHADLLAAGRRLLPADGYITDGRPDTELVNLNTSVGALRQLIAAVKACEAAE